MKRKISLVLALVMALTMLLSVAGSASASALEGTINYWTLWNETDKQGEVTKAAVEDFMAKNPGVTVNVNWLGRDIRQTIKAALDAGSVDMWDNAVSYMAKDYADYAIDVEPLMAAIGYNAQPSLIANVKNFTGGVVNCVPYQPNIMPLWYNAEHFEKAGITEMPKDTDEFLEVCAKLKAAGFTPMSVDAGYILLPFTTYLGRLKGIEFATALVKDKTGAMMDDPAFLEAAKFIETLAKEGYYSERSGSLAYPDGQNEFAMGDVSMYMVPSYFVGEVLEITGDDFPWGAMEIPSPKGAVLQNTATNLGSQGFMITKTCKNPEAAMALIAHLTTGEWDAKMAENSINLPTMADTQAPAALDVVMPVVKTWTDMIPWAAGMTENADFTPTFKDLLQKLSGGAITAEQFVEECKKAVIGG